MYTTCHRIIPYDQETIPIADTLDQDSDKMKTYDLCRARHSHIQSILFLDSDELLYCPEDAFSSTAMNQVGILVKIYSVLFAL